MSTALEFRKGFLLKLAELGITPADLGRFLSMRKEAVEWLELLAPATLLATVTGGLGYLGGSQLAKATISSPKDYIRNIKQQELIATYQKALRELELASSSNQQEEERK